MPGEEFTDPRLAVLYDALQGERVDLDPYVALALELRARDVVDLGCGTGVLAARLADEGLRVEGVDPAEASLAVARARPGGERVEWTPGEIDAVRTPAADLVLMTGNAAQAVTGDGPWAALLGRVRSLLRPAGRFVFETREPSLREWRGWTPAAVRETEVPGVGRVLDWTEIIEEALPLVSFRTTWRFPDGREPTSDSTIRFRTEDEVRADLADAGLEVLEIRDAPDRPGRELVFVAGRA